MNLYIVKTITYIVYSEEKHHTVHLITTVSEATSQAPTRKRQTSRLHQTPSKREKWKQGEGSAETIKVTIKQNDVSIYMGLAS